MKTKISFGSFFLSCMIVLTACTSSATPTQSTVGVDTTAPTETLVPVATLTVMEQRATPTMETKVQSPACSFPLDQTTTVESGSDEYTFSQPKSVSTDTSVIVDWLPDGQSVIIMPMNLIDLGLIGYQQTIELFNAETQRTQIYAIRIEGAGMPAWNAGLRAIVYPDTKMVGTDIESVQFFSQLWISYGNPDTAQLLADDLPNHSVTVRPDGSEIVIQKNSGEQVYQLFGRQLSNDSLQAEQLIAFDPAQLGDYDSLPIAYKTVWRPGTSQMFFHSYVSPTNQTLLLDVKTGQSCSISFDGWVYFARWSPNGRYLAVIKSPSSHLSLWADFELSVLDALTGTVYHIDSTKVGPESMKNCCRHVIADLSWAPDNHQLAVLGMVHLVGTGPPPAIKKLYLVDFQSGNVEDIFPSYQFDTYGWGTGLAWSPDGLKILANCSQDGLCLIPVKRAAKP